MNPWEKYASPATPQAEGGPWSKYAAPKDPWADINFDAPEADVRASIGQLDPQHQTNATKAWAERAVAKDRAQHPNLQPMAELTLPFSNEITSGINAGIHAVTGGAFGQPYDEGVIFKRERQRQTREANPVTQTVADVAGGFLMPTPGAPALTAMGRMGHATAASTGYGTLYGAAEGEQGLAGRVEGGIKGGVTGFVAGPIIHGAFEGVAAASRMMQGRGQNGAYAKVVESLADDPAGGSAVDNLAAQYSAGAGSANLQGQRRALDILGEEMERAGGNRTAAIPATVNRIAQEFNVSPATAQANIRDLANLHRDSPLFFGEYQTVAGSDAAMRGPNGGRIRPQNANLDDLGRVEESGVANQLDYLANNGNAQSATITRNNVRNRQEILSNSMDNAIDTLPATGRGANAYGGTPQVQTGPNSTRAADIVDTGQMVDAARQAGSAEYRAAYSAPTNNYVLVNWLPRLLGRYDQMAAARSGEYAEAMRRATDQFVLRLPDGRRTTMQTLQQLQDARGAVRGMMDGYAAQNRNDLARVVRPIYDQVTRMMEYANPAWGRANRMWADMNFLRMGQELGDSFAQKAGPRFREQLGEFRNLAPQAQDIVRVHFLQQIKDKLANAGDTHSLSKFFSNNHNREAIRTLFGDEAAISFTRAVRNQKAAEQTQAMLQNSKTHRRMQTQKQMDADTGLITAVENASVTNARSAILDWIKQRITEGRNRPLANILTTPLQDTAGVAQHIHNLRRAEQRAAHAARPRDTAKPAGVTGGFLGGLVGRSEQERKERRGFAGQRI